MIFLHPHLNLITIIFVELQLQEYVPLILHILAYNLYQILVIINIVVVVFDYLIANGIAES